MGRNKFLGLHQYFSHLDEEQITLSFAQIESLIGEQLSASAYKYSAYWHPSKTHTITRCWQENGYQLCNLSLSEKHITFLKQNNAGVSGIKKPIEVTPHRISAPKKYPTVDMEKVLSGINKYYVEIEADENARYISWEHCFSAFQEAHKLSEISEKDVDYLSLHLSFFLASWGMLRGSSFLFQKDYRVQRDIVRELLRPCYHELWSIRYQGLKEKKNLDSLMELIEQLKKIYREKRKNIKEADADISDILISKVLLGTLGCIPAYDIYFKKAVVHYKVTTQMLNQTSFKGLAKYYEENEAKLEEVRNTISEARQIEYPQMKILDMAFWQLGYDL